MNEEKLTRSGSAAQSRDPARKKTRSNFQTRSERVQTEIDPNVAPLNLSEFNMRKLKIFKRKS